MKIFLKYKLLDNFCCLVVHFFLMTINLFLVTINFFLMSLQNLLKVHFMFFFLHIWMVFFTFWCAGIVCPQSDVNVHSYLPVVWTLEHQIHSTIALQYACSRHLRLLSKSRDS